MLKNKLVPKIRLEFRLLFTRKHVFVFVFAAFTVRRCYAEYLDRAILSRLCVHRSRAMQEVLALRFRWPNYGIA